MEIVSEETISLIKNQNPVSFLNELLQKERLPEAIYNFESKLQAEHLCICSVDKMNVKVQAKASSKKEAKSKEISRNFYIIGFGRDI